MPLSDEHRRKRGRNLALAGVLFFLVVLFFVVSIVKMKGG
jgi:predicted nucleic acid-binding Zn ribbon protein